MDTKKGENNQDKGQDNWRGQEVADAPGDVAEEAAARAGGRGPTGPVDAGSGAPEQVQASKRGSERPSPADEKRSQTEKQRAAAEAHEKDKNDGTRTAPRKI